MGNKIQRIYTGTNLVRPDTLTIQWTEKSDMSSGWVYSDGATGLTAGSTTFDEFFGYSAVKLNSAGVETAEVKQSSPGILDITQLGTLTSGDNVMIKFPVRGIKMSKSGSAVTLSITKRLGREADGFQYYAFQKTGDVVANASTTVATYPLYIGSYISYKDGSTLKSWSGKTPSLNILIGNSLTYAANNGTGYTLLGFYQRQLISAYYMMKYGNPNCQTTIGMGYVSASGTTHNTGGTDGEINASYGTTSGTVQCKLFGLEDWRGNKNQWLGGMFTDGSKNIYTALHDFTSSTSTSQSQYKLVGTMNASASYISSILGTNTGMFIPTATSGSETTYYCDQGNVATTRVAVTGGHSGNNLSSGIFKIYAEMGTNYTDNNVACRIMYL